MDRSNDQVERGQGFVGKVEAAVGQDVDLGPVQDPRQARSGIDGRDLGGASSKALGCQPLGDLQRLRVVGQDDVVIAALLGGSRHLGDLVAPVAPITVRVQVAAQVSPLHQV